MLGGVEPVPPPFLLTMEGDTGAGRTAKKHADTIGPQRSLSLTSPTVRLNRPTLRIANSVTVSPICHMLGVFTMFVWGCRGCDEWKEVSGGGITCGGGDGSGSSHDSILLSGIGVVLVAV